MKVLIICHNPFNKELPNGRTLLELFSSFNSSDIAEIYFHPDIPDFSVCKNYYRITDGEMIKHGLFGKAGKAISSENKSDIVPASRANRSRIYRIGSRKGSVAILIRNMIWTFGRWFNSDLKKWIEEFNPDVIFLYLGNYVFPINIAKRISNYVNIPNITYIVDDYFFNKDLKKGLFGFFNHIQYSNKLKELLSNSNTVCLNEYMKNEYSKVFHGHYDVLYTVSSLNPFPNKVHASKLKMSYLGGIACERYKSLIDIAKIIADNDLPIEFTIYTRENRAWLLEPLREAKGLVLHDGLSYSEVIGVMEDSDILVHVEGFSPQAKELVRFSMSTKIADSLSCNRCLLAYGPRGVASIDYLIDNECAHVAVDTKELQTILEKMCEEHAYIDKYLEKQQEVAHKNHTKSISHSKLISCINNAVQSFRKKDGN